MWEVRQEQERVARIDHAKTILAGLSPEEKSQLLLDNG